MAAAGETSPAEYIDLAVTLPYSAASRRAKWHRLNFWTIRAEEAVTALTSDLPDVCFLDIQIPGSNGFEVLARLPTLRVDTGKLHEALDQYGIANTLEVYPGTHTSAVADRFQNHLMRFFSDNLCHGSGCR
jgi:CheY-like chemotaxis protein